MSRVNYYAKFVFYFAVDMFVPGLTAVLINIHNTAPGDSYLLPLGAVIFILLVLSHVIAERFSLQAVYFLVPLGIILLVLTGSYWLTALLIAGFSVWTLEQLHDNIDNHYNEKMMIIMLLFVIILNLINTPEIDAHQLQLHLIAAGMFVFYFLGRIFMLMTGSGWDFTSRAWVFAVSSAFLITAAALFTGLYKYAEFAVQTVIIFLINGFIMLLRPFFSFLETVEFKFPDMEQEQMEVNEDGNAVNETFEGTTAVSEVPVMTILIVLTVIGIGVFLLMYFRKRSRPVKSTAESKSYTTSVRTSTTKEKLTPAVSVPEGEVRKQYYAFEKWLAGRNLGRYHGETIDEWAERMNIGNTELLERYKQYRYDSREMTAEEFYEFKEMIKNIKPLLGDKSS
ncbi:hypothetical protein BN1048_02162 [Jeotgalicoccus saudimassiliensis]|uniref:DUF4129 domain-containing protein n=1 Tax=Jeotgalicoccus saudimassiliensis TaxID=1461582 RepID=A0A078M8D6_9STAP|nr:DUF4129 domain-containing protein [Jeotgalicoccus saudimassiliensis]CEA03653.1 hypothetical protein BN1048_02162 [Jeotgalicoccus saudimassiliensis]